MLADLVAQHPKRFGAMVDRVNQSQDCRSHASKRIHRFALYEKFRSCSPLSLRRPLWARLHHPPRNRARISLASANLLAENKAQREQCCPRWGAASIPGGLEPRTEMTDTSLKLFEPDDEGPIPSGPLTIEQVIQLYLDNGIKSSSPDSLKERERVLSDFSGEVGRQPVAQAKPAVLLWWINKHSAWASNWTIKRVISTIQACFNWAAKYGIIERNPFKGISHEQGDNGRAMEQAEFQALMRNSSPVFRRVLVFLRFSGCRPGEMSSLEWSFLDRERGCFTIWKHKTLKTRRDKKPRIIVLDSVLLKLLAWIERNRPDPKHVFLNAKRRAWNRYALGTRIKRLRKKIGLDLSMKLYGLRHRFGSQAILNGVDLKTTSVLMGHASTRICESVYVHIEGEIDHLQGAMKKANHKPPPAP